MSGKIKKRVSLVLRNSDSELEVVILSNETLEVHVENDNTHDYAVYSLFGEDKQKFLDFLND